MLLVLVRWLRASTRNERLLSCVLPSELATPPGIQVDHYLEGEPCTYVYMNGSAACLSFLLLFSKGLT